jgi:hypothetical protein
MTSDDEQNTAISYYIEEVEQNNEENDLDIDELLNELNEKVLSDDLSVPHMINYHENYTVKELLLICEYYGFAKDMKANKFNKEQIIDYLVGFESDLANTDIVFRRQNMWFYINELKNDKFMKKFVLW